MVENIFTNSCPYPNDNRQVLNVLPSSSRGDVLHVTGAGQVTWWAFNLSASRQSTDPQRTIGHYFRRRTTKVVDNGPSKNRPNFANLATENREIIGWWGARNKQNFPRMKKKVNTKKLGHHGSIFQIWHSEICSASARIERLPSRTNLPISV